MRETYRWGLMTTINYGQMEDIFPDDHYMSQPMFVDPELPVADIVVRPEYEQVVDTLEKYLKDPEKIERELRGEP